MRLGCGSFGAVVTGLLHGSPVAVKLPLDRGGGNKLDALPELINELRVLRQGRHPNLVQLIGAVVDSKQNTIGLVLELVAGKRLDEFIQSEDGSRVRYQHQIILGLSSALWYLHSRKPTIVHGDIKDKNILVVKQNHDAQPKLLDFGLSRLLTKKSRLLCGTLARMAPELVINQAFGLIRHALQAHSTAEIVSASV
jgi:serine/threonine protein kinase